MSAHWHCLLRHRYQNIVPCACPAMTSVQMSACSGKLECLGVTFLKCNLHSALIMNAPLLCCDAAKNLRGNLCNRN